MIKKMIIHYDPEGDFLEVRFGPVTPSYYENIGDDIFERRDRGSKEIKGYAIFNVKKRKINELKDIEVDIPSLAQ